MGLHFDLSPDQRMLATSLRRLLGNCRAPDFKETAASLAGHGMFGVMVAEMHGGLGLGLTDALALSFETGRAGLAFPATETTLALPLLARVRPDALQEAMAGRQIVTLASTAKTKVTRERGRMRLCGEAIAPFARQANWLALMVGENAATVIDLTGRGVSIEALPEFDPAGPLFRVCFDYLAEAKTVLPDDLATKAAILACGEMAGAAEYCFECSIRHLNERTQFGKPLGANQVLRHAAADDWLRVQGMQAAAEYAAAAHDDSPAYASHDAMVAKAYCSQVARKVAESAIHLHGGMGFTWDAGLHLPLRRILRLAASYGTATEHLDSLAGRLFAARTHDEEDRTCHSNNIASM